jgi:hypothetical protein
MTTEKLKAIDTVSSGLTCNLKTGEDAKATGLFEIKCHDKDGNLKWEAQSKNLVVNAGLAYIAGSALTSTAVHAVAMAMAVPTRLHHARSFCIKDLLLLWAECGVQGFGGVSAAVHEGVHL